MKQHLENLKRVHYSARHFCYAYQLGVDEIRYRVNDDGEPSNSAGQPIYGQILSYGVTNILIVVVRYFGGTKLGVGGLMNAYKTVAKLGLEAANICDKIIESHYKVTFKYEHLNKIMRVIKEQNLDILEQQMHLSCEMIISTRRKNEVKIENIFEELHVVNIKKLVPNGN